MNVDELFRNKLEYSEIAPAEAIRSNLMKKLGRKEFLRFNPSRFNIFYLGGAVATVIIGTILLTSGPVRNVNPENISPLVGKIISDSGSDKAETNLPPAEKVVPEITGREKPAVKRAESKSGEVKARPDLQIKKDVLPSSRQASSKSDSLVKKSIIKDNPGNPDSYSLKQKTSAGFEVSSLSGCSPFKVKFNNRSFAYDSCKWTFGDGGYSTEKNPVWIFDREGEYKVTLKVFGENKTEVTSSSLITVHPRPVARFEIEPENPAIPDDEVQFHNYSENAVRFRWEFGDGKISDIFEPVHKYTQYSKYNVRLIVWSDFGCPDSLLIKNAFSGSGYKIEFPNAFIPNSSGPTGGSYSNKSDEAAQVFHPVATAVTEYQLKIFSKTGILIFESNDLSIGWDGYNKGQLCEPGVYIWKVRGKFKNGEPFVKMGDVTLIKN